MLFTDNETRSSSVEIIGSIGFPRGNRSLGYFDGIVRRPLVLRNSNKSTRRRVAVTRRARNTEPGRRSRSGNTHFRDSPKHNYYYRGRYCAISRVVLPDFENHRMYARIGATRKTRKNTY